MFNSWVELKLLSWNYLELLRFSWECVVTYKYGTTQNDPNPSKTHEKRPKTTKEINKTKQNRLQISQSITKWLRDHGILKKKKQKKKNKVFSSPNVCHSGYQVIWSGVVLGFVS